MRERDDNLVSGEVRLVRDDTAFQHFVDSVPIGIYRSSLDGKQLRANPALARLNGYSSEQELLAARRGGAADWYVDPERRRTFERLMVRDGRVKDFESEVYRHRTKERIWVSENAWLIHDDAGTPLFYEGTVIDISSHKQNERRLHQLSTFQAALIRFVEDSLASGLDESFFQRLLNRAVEVVPGAQAGSILLQGEDGRFRFVAAVNYDLGELRFVSLHPEELFVDLDQQSAQRICHHQSARPVRDERLSILRAAGRVGELKATLATPIHLGTNAVAYISLNNFEDADAFSDEACEMSNIFAKQVGGLMQRFALEQELRRRQQALERLSTFRSSLLGFMQETLRRGLDETLYRRLLEYASRAIPGVEAGSILLRDSSSRFGFAAALGYPLEALKAVTFAEDELIDNMQTSSLHDNLAERSAELVRDERLEILRRHGRLDDIRSFLSLPVRIENEVMAVLNLDAFKPNAFDSEAVEMGNTFAAQVGSLLQRQALERELAQSNTALAKLANYDALTGLPNRTLLAERLERAFTLARHSHTRVGVLFLDLDGFKVVNDSLGHSYGDRLLRQVAERLRSCLSDGDTVARLGGDEFTLVLNHLQQPRDAAYVAQKVLDSLREPFQLAGHSLQIGGSIGITCFPDNGESVGTLLQHADTAMYHAKARGTGRYHFFTPSMNARVLEQLQIESDMRRALSSEAFRLEFQPRVHLGSGRVTSFEALARWQHPERGMISPYVFIPVAERSGLIGALGERTLRQACRQAASWRQSGLAVRVAVNLSVKQLHDPAIAETVRQVLAETGLEPSGLELEITESAAMTDVELSVATLSELRKMGVYLSIDDFGTAYSSLNYLKRLPIDSLKIDRSFVQGLDKPEASADNAIVRAIVALGKSLGYDLIAEGVETEAQLAALRQFGCQEAQGYLFSRPLPPEEAQLWARRSLLV